MIFAVLWAAGVAFADFVYARWVVLQGRTASFAQADGEITASAVTTSRTSEGEIIHGVDLAYTYVVGARTYHGSRYGVTAVKESGSWAADLVRQLPVGARVVVHHAPEDPSEAVLRAGLSAAAAFPAFILFPFHVIALRLLSTARRESGGVTRVPSEAPSRFGAALLWATLGDFLLSVVVAVRFGSEPPASALIQLLGLVLILAALGLWTAHRRLRAQSGSAAPQKALL